MRVKPYSLIYSGYYFTIDFEVANSINFEVTAYLISQGSMAFSATVIAIIAMKVFTRVTNPITRIDFTKRILILGFELAAETYLEHNQISKRELFGKIISGF